METTIMRSAPCSECGAQMLWTQNAWRADDDGVANAALSLCERPPVEPVHHASVSGLRRPQHRTVEQRQRPPELPMCALWEVVSVPDDPRVTISGLDGVHSRFRSRSMTSSRRVVSIASSA